MAVATEPRTPGLGGTLESRAPAGAPEKKYKGPPYDCDFLEISRFKGAPRSGSEGASLTLATALEKLKQQLNATSLRYNEEVTIGKVRLGTGKASVHND